VAKSVLQGGENTTRRRFLEKLLGFVSTLTGLGFLGTVVAYFRPKKEEAGGNILRSGDGEPIPADRLKTESSVIGIGIRGEPTIVIRYEGEMRAFSAVCTHLGCLVRWVPQRGEFFCPCHAGRFDANGINIAGPPPRPLPRYRSYVTEDGFIGLEGPLA